MKRAIQFSRYLSIGFLVLSILIPAGIASAGERPAAQGHGTGLRGASYNPTLTVWLTDNNRDVEGSGWIIGDSITLTVDDPGTAPSPDYATSAVAGPAPWDETSGHVEFLLDGIIDIEPGFTVTLRDAITTKTLIEPLIEVSAADPLSDTVTGKATAGLRVAVEPYGDEARRYAVADSNGDWEVDFSTTGTEPDELTLFDIQFGSDGNATIRDADGDGVAYDWRAPDTRFVVFLFDPMHDPYQGMMSDIQGYEWPAGLPVTLTIDRPATPQSPDYTNTQSQGEAEPQGTVHFYFNTDGFEIIPGDIVTVSNGTITLNGTITDLAVSMLDPETDTVTGTAEPGSLVQVGLVDLDVWREVTTDPEGAWEADFSIPGAGPNESQTVDIVPGQRFFISQGLQLFPINVPNPHIEAHSKSNWIFADEWPFGAQLTLMIDDPNTAQPVDYSDTALAEINTEKRDPYYTTAGFDLGEFDLKAGHVVSILYASKVKSYTVQPIRITDVDFSTDTVSGTGVVGHEIQVCVYTTSDPVCRHVIVDVEGNYSADFHTPGPSPDESRTADLQPGVRGWNHDREADGDLTVVEWMARAYVYLPIITRGGP